VAQKLDQEEIGIIGRSPSHQIGGYELGKDPNETSLQQQWLLYNPGRTTIEQIIRKIPSFNLQENLPMGPDNRNGQHELFQSGGIG
jgi:hypothetical protein